MTRRGILRTLSIGTAAVLLAGTTAVGAGAASPKADPLSGNAHSEAEATRRADVMLDRVHLPGAVRDPTPVEFGTITSGENNTDVPRWFTVRGTRDSVIHFARLHPPRGFVSAGPSFHLPAFGKNPASTILTFKQQDRPHSSMHVLALVTTDAGHGEVNLRADATVAWIPARTQLESVPDKPDYAKLEFSEVGTTGGSIHRVPSAAQMRRLARRLNALRTTSADVRNDCLGSQYSATLFLHYGGHRAEFFIPVPDTAPTECDWVSVWVDGVHQPLLALDKPTLATLRSIVG